MIQTDRADFDLMSTYQFCFQSNTRMDRLNQSQTASLAKTRMQAKFKTYNFKLRNTINLNINKLLKNIR